MADASDAIEAAAFTALSGRAALTALAPVHQHVPEDTPPPVVIVADLSEDGAVLAAKDDDDVQADLTIESVVKGKARKPLLAIQGEVKAALNQLRVVQGGWSLTFVFAGSDAQLTGEGETYVGSSRFTVFAFRT